MMSAYRSGAASLERGGNLVIVLFVKQDILGAVLWFKKKPLPFRGSLVSRRQFAEAIWRDDESIFNPKK